MSPDQINLQSASLPSLQPNPLRAAQYVRMSTEHQQYSTNNQSDKILEYARHRNIEIVRTYADEGKSGLSLGGRASLQKLIADVETGVADFSLVLVYDVSRWGRFQDADEAAYHEYKLKSKGIRVAYVAEQFENDGSPVSTIVKGVKRAMAGEYSRELSAKVFAGQCRLIELGFRQGGAIHRALGYSGHAGTAIPLRRFLPSIFEQAWVPRPGVHVIPVNPPVVPTYWGTALLFACPPLAAPMLVFGVRQCESPEIPPTGVVTVAVRKVYFVINDVSLHLASNGVEVPVHSLSLSLDAASWAWGFDAALPPSAQSLIEPSGSGVVELLASVNGTTFAVLAENIGRERSFGQTSIRLTGRGKNAALAAPYAPVMTFTNSQARTARQLMDDVLTINGVPMGWSVDWGLNDWNVPAGVFSHQGTWIEALSVIADAAGAYLLPHPRDPTIRVRHRYPVAPWEWNTVTPNFVLPVEAIEKESLRWLEKPSYNRVFVSGQQAGVLAQVTRTGTAGEKLAPMVVDALITEAAVARQRGLAVLSDTGRQIEVSLNLPVLLDTGIIEPGAFVQYRDAGVDRIGLVRSTQVQAGFPEVWQNLGVLTYV